MTAQSFLPSGFDLLYGDDLEDCPVAAQSSVPVGELTHDLDVLVFEFLGLPGQAIQLYRFDRFAVNGESRIELNGPTRGFSPHLHDIDQLASHGDRILRLGRRL